MQTSNNTILITGGSSGIGLAMTEAFLAAKNKVLICGRDQLKLNQLKQKFPALETYACDISKKNEREKLVEWAATITPAVNILINNAGIQKELDFIKEEAHAIAFEEEIETNLTASIHLSALFISKFLKLNTKCAVINVTSGLAFIPLKIVPVYCATKAALHSFSMSLRSQLAETNIRVFEIAPPIVKTNLHREAKARKQAERGIAPETVADATLKALKNDTYQVIIGQARTLKAVARFAPNFFHQLLNKVATK